MCAFKVSGAEGNRTPVQTSREKAFYMLILLLIVGKTRSVWPPTFYLAFYTIRISRRHAKVWSFMMPVTCRRPEVLQGWHCYKIPCIRQQGRSYTRHLKGWKLGLRCHTDNAPHAYQSGNPAVKASRPHFLQRYKQFASQVKLFYAKTF